MNKANPARRPVSRATRRSPARSRVGEAREIGRVRIRPRRKTHPRGSTAPPSKDVGPRELLQKLAACWPGRAQVRKGELDVSLWDPGKDDFVAPLLPFYDHPYFHAAHRELKRKVLSCGWLAYNEKTVDIEAKIITPACVDIIKGNLPGLEDGVCREIASETMVDEAFHILLVARANEITRTQRGLASVPIPSCNLVRETTACRNGYGQRWQRTLIGIATAIVSEVFISDYLKLLSDDASIQPFNRLTVASHRRDELAHAPIFRNLAKRLYAALNEKERAFFRSVLPLPVRWFANQEFDVWRAMLEHIRFPDAAHLIRDSRELTDENLLTLDYSDLVSLAEELGMLQTQHGVDCFGEQGLLN